MADDDEDDKLPDDLSGMLGDDAAADGDAGGDDAEESVDDKLASEWAAMDGKDGASGDTGGDGAPISARVLNQDEIDSLLGFSEDDDTERSGIRAIIDSGMVSYEHLPMLEVVFDRLVRMMSTSMRNFTSDNVEVSLDNITSIRFGDYLNSIPLPAMLAVFKAEEWDNFGLITVDSSLIYSIVDVLLGGRRGTAAMRIEGRALYHDRTQPRRADDQRRNGGPWRRLRSAEFGDLPLRPAGNEPAVRYHCAPGQRGDSGASTDRYGGSRRAP